MTTDNAGLAELLAREAERVQGTLRRAFKRAARAAFLWPIEAGELLKQERSLTELTAVGPYIERRLKRWLQRPPHDLEPPPIRRGFLTLSQAKMALSRKGEWQKQYRGDLQMHSHWSDGAGSIRHMAEAAQERGYEYIAITDHSQGLKIAGGITEAELAQQMEEIRRYNDGCKARRQTFRVLCSLEMNLNPRGGGDMAESILKKLDLVVGSFHSKLREKTDQTDRYLAALNNPCVNILGHPVGRVYNFRVGLSADWHRVCARAAQLDKALEIDAYPDRQDLSTELLKIAKTEGARIAINTDAHAPEQLAFVELGLAAALMAGIPAERIVNFMPLDKLLAWAKPKAKKK